MRSWLTRLMVGTQVSDAPGHALDLRSCLQPYGPAVVDLAVYVGVSHRLPARLIAVGVPPAVAHQRRRSLRADARRRGQTVSQERVRLADWTLFLTTVPPTLLSAAEALVVA